MMVYARGARKPKSKFLSGAQIFTYADYVLAEGRGFYSVNQADVIESFYSIRKDYDSLVAAYSIVGICEKSLLDNMPADELLLLALKSLSLLSKGSFPSLQISAVFLIRFFLWNGLAPEVERCGTCDTPLAKIQNVLFTAEGILCKNHMPSGEQTNSFTISKSAAHALLHILTNSMPQSFSFRASDTVINELQKIGRTLWNGHFEGNLAD